MLGARDDRLELREHLAAIAHTEGKGLGTLKKLDELSGKAGVEEDGPCPAGPAAKDVAVREAAAGHQASEVAKAVTPVNQVSHVDIEGIEPRQIEGGSHLDLAVDALLSQHGDSGSSSDVNERGGDIDGRVETEMHGKRRLGASAIAVELLAGADRVIAQRGDPEGGFAPGGMQHRARFAPDSLGIPPDLDDIAVIGLADHMRNPRQARFTQNAEDTVARRLADLNHDPCLFGKECLHAQLVALHCHLLGPDLEVAPVG